MTSHPLIIGAGWSPRPPDLHTFQAIVHAPTGIARLRPKPTNVAPRTAELRRRLRPGLASAPAPRPARSSPGRPGKAVRPGLPTRKTGPDLHQLLVGVAGFEPTASSCRSVLPQTCHRSSGLPIACARAGER